MYCYYSRAICNKEFFNRVFVSQPLVGSGNATTELTPPCKRRSDLVLNGQMRVPK